MSRVEFEITEFKPSEIKTNFSDIRESVEADIAKYRGLVVTEEHLPMCRKAKADLAQQSKNIEIIRKEVKKKLSEPIVEFDAVCKEVQAVIAEVADPIKEGIAELNEKARQEKLESIKEVVAEIASKMNYTDTDKIVIKEEFGNVSKTIKDIRQDITEQILMLQAEEKAKEKQKEVLETIITLENENIRTKMSLDDFAEYIEEGYEDSVIIRKIKERAKVIADAEKNICREETVEPEAAENNDSYLIRIFDRADTAEDVIRVLAANGYMALVE